jgi:hypothetical protein
MNSIVAALRAAGTTPKGVGPGCRGRLLPSRTAAAVRVRCRFEHGMESRRSRPCMRTCTSCTLGVGETGRTDGSEHVASKADVAWRAIQSPNGDGAGDTARSPGGGKTRADRGGSRPVVADGADARAERAREARRPRDGGASPKAFGRRVRSGHRRARLGDYSYDERTASGRRPRARHGGAPSPSSRGQDVWDSAPRASARRCRPPGEAVFRPRLERP